MSNVAIGEFGDAVEAELARGLLTAHGIEARVLLDDAGGQHPELVVGRGISLLVKAEDETEALELLEEINRN